MTDFQLEELAPRRDGAIEPTLLESTQFFFLERGVSLEKFNELPIPYILAMVNTFYYIEKEKEKQYKKAQKK